MDAIFRERVKVPETLRSQKRRVRTKLGPEYINQEVLDVHSKRKGNCNCINLRSLRP